ncbi:MAG: hypothetical protein ACM34M_06525 [Ignavibacteria bacterium]
MINQYRENLIQLVLDFVIACRKIESIQRIAIIGSLLSEKKKPKDVDLLLNIPDDLELTKLAKISRTLQGKSGSIGGGADIFLANSNNEYIGRACIWKDCRFGARIRCDAINCGKRKYLHDDLNAITLKRELIDNPSLILFPSIIRNVPIPIDVEEGLLKNIYKNAT